jgi:transposase
VLYTGIPWEFLPQELGFRSGMTCWRPAAGLAAGRAWQWLHEALLAELKAAGALDWSRAVIVSSHVRALRGGPKRARARPAVPGSKHHLITEAHGIPLAVSLTGGHRNDVTQVLPLIEAIPPVRGRRGRPRQRPNHLYADRSYDHDEYRAPGPEGRHHPTPLLRARFIQAG